MTSIAYVNRRTEQNEAIAALMASETKILLYQCNSGYGITAFFKRLQYVLQSTDSIVIFNAELSDNRRDPIHQIVNTLTASNSGWTQAMQNLADEVYGEHEDSILKGGLKGIPYVGELLAALVDPQKALPVYTGFYADRLKELFFHLMNEGMHDKSVYIFIDNIQFVDTSSTYEIISLLQMPNVKLVLSYTGIADAADKLLLEIECSFYHLCRKPFGMPDEKHIIELGEVLNSAITPQEAKNILFHSNGNIRKIIYEIKKGPVFENANQSVMKVILSVSLICKAPLDTDELFAMISMSHVGMLITENDYVDALRCLEARGFIYTVLTLERKNQIFPLFDAATSTIWNNLRSDLADMLVSKSLVLRFLNKTKDGLPFEKKQLGFSLSKELREPVTFWCRQLIVEALQNGYLIENEWLDEYTPNESSDQFVYAVALYKNHRYPKAKDLLEGLLRNSFNSRNVKLLYAFTLNRCRKHQASEYLLRQLLRSSICKNEQAILLSFLVSNCVHKKDLPQGKELVKTWTKQLEGCTYAGYFLRNAAALYSNDISYVYWSEALRLFVENNDDYGICTTRANMGRYYYYKGDIKRSIAVLEQAYQGLLKYGERQLHMIANNLGACYLLDSRLPDAYKYLQLSLSIAKSIVPRAYATMNLSGYYFAQNDYAAAHDSLLRLHSDVMSSNLHRLKARFMFAFAVTHYFCGNIAAAKGCLSEYKRHSDDAVDGSIGTALQVLTVRIDDEVMFQEAENWKPYFSPCFMEYWLSNPLCVISDDALASKTVI